MKPFNLEKALAGEKVVTGAGKEVTELTYFKTINGKYKVRAVIGGELDSFTEEGWHDYSHKNDKMDLFMAPVQRIQYGIMVGRQVDETFDSFDKAFTVSKNMDCQHHIVTITWEE